MRKFASLLGLLVLIGLALAGVFAIVASSGCLPGEGVPIRDFPIEAMLIPVRAFPKGWTDDPTGPSAPPLPPLGGYKSIERTEVFFYIANGVATEEIHRFACTRQAADAFASSKHSEFAEGEFSRGWLPPTELQYRSPIAEQFYLACGQHGSIRMCRAIGQYQEYFVLFNTHMSPGFMTYADLEKILRAIDGPMARYLRMDIPDAMPSSP